MDYFRHIRFIVPAVLMLACNNQKITLQEKPVINVQHASAVLHQVPANTSMVYISGGEYQPFYGQNNNPVTVKPFLIDETPVTNKDFLTFLKVNPQWRKSNIKRIYADTTYLYNWPADLELPEGANPDAPVCYVSWFAANAYARSVGKRLPTLDEWEFVAMADAKTANARSKPTYSDDILDLYLQKDRQYQPVKQSQPNYWGVYNVFDLTWEWTHDFNSVFTTGDSREGEVDNQNLFCAGGATSATDVLNYAAYMRFALRASIKANYTVANLGFRCAKDTIIN